MNVLSSERVRTSATAALLLVLLSTGPDPARVQAATPTGACKRTCATGLAECRAAAKARRAMLRRICTVTPVGHRTCRTTTRRTVSAMMGSCSALGKHCKECCRTGAAICAGAEATLDESRRVTVLVPPAGGTIDATSADGTAYRLEIPAGALDVAESIALTPLTRLGPFPVDGRRLAAVHAEPSGLRFVVPATLSITPPQPFAGRMVAFAYDGRGEDLRTTPLASGGTTVTLPVTHFSGFGTGIESSPELQAIGAQSMSAASNRFAAELSALDAQGVTDPAAWIDVARRWYRDVVRPGLQAGVGSDARLRLALKDYDQWLTILQTSATLFVAAIDLSTPLAAEQADASTLIAAALRDAIARANARCLAQHSLAEAETALEWQVIAGAADVDTPANALDLDTVLDGLCIAARYDDVTYPADPPLGVASELALSVGLAFIDGVPATGATMAVDIRPRGTVELFAGPFDTNPDGSFAADFTPAGDRELRLDIRSCGHVPGRRRLGRVCQDAFVVRGLRVEPAQATLAPGATQSFQAVLFGQPTAAVDWSATGGALDATETFTAGGTPGTFEVRATSTVDGHSAAATVVITGTTVTTTSSTSTTTLPGNLQGVIERRLAMGSSAGYTSIGTGRERRTPAMILCHDVGFPDADIPVGGSFAYSACDAQGQFEVIQPAANVLTVAETLTTVSSDPDFSVVVFDLYTRLTVPGPGQLVVRLDVSGVTLAGLSPLNAGAGPIPGTSLSLSSISGGAYDFSPLAVSGPGDVDLHLLHNEKAGASGQATWTIRFEP